MPEFKQVFGTNNALIECEGHVWDNFFKQGGALSNFANKIPGVNSLARLHDQYQIGFGDPDGWIRKWLNLPAMVPATLANYGALIETIPAYPMFFEDYWDSTKRSN